MTLRLDSPPFGGARGRRRSAWWLLVERGLDELAKPISRHFPISLSAAMPVAMYDQHALARKPCSQTRNQACLGVWTDAAGLPKIPAQCDAGARSVDVLTSRATRATRQLHDLGSRNPIPPRKWEVAVPPSPASLHHILAPDRPRPASTAFSVRPSESSLVGRFVYRGGRRTSASRPSS